MLMSDNLIRCQCERPTHIYYAPNGVIEYSSFPHPYHHRLAMDNTMANNIVYKINSLEQNKAVCFPISQRELDEWEPMISPYVNSNVKEEDGKRIISYGVSSYGYDVRIGNKFKIFTNINSTVINPKNFDVNSFVDFEGDVCIIPPNSFVLAASLEKFNMPRNVTGLVLGKSTYARIGVNCLATPLESEWSGYVTLEFSNNTPLPVMLFANEGAAQVLFFSGDDCNTSYNDRGGKYQNQEAGPVLPKV